MRVLVFDYFDYYDFEKDFVNNEDEFFTKAIEKKYEILIINFDFYPQYLEIMDYCEAVVIFMCDFCDEFKYKKVLKVADYCYTYNELFKLKIRLDYLEKKLSKLNTKVYKYNDLVYNLNTNQLFKNSIPIKLTKAENDVLKTLIKNRNHFLSKEEIKAMSDSIDSIGSIKVIISNLRKLGFDIENIKNLGYRLKENK